MNILERILQQKHIEVRNLLKEPIAEKEEKSLRPSLFDKLYKSDHLHVIAEIKRASPSKGLIAVGVDPVEQAILYEQADVACISVLTDTHFFQGCFDDLSVVADSVSIPVLCKDFMIHPVQIDRAKNAGASVILLIVAALSFEDLCDLYDYALGVGLEVLVEVHDEFELKRALALGANLIGINNRDLRTFEIDLKRTEEIAKMFPFGEKRVLISESGILEVNDALCVSKCGVSAVLVGESLMRSNSVVNDIKCLQVDLIKKIR